MELCLSSLQSFPTFFTMRMNKKFFSFWSDTKISKSRCMPSERREEVDGRRKCRKQKQRVKVGTVGIVNGKQL